MPKSKRQKIVNLTKATKKGRAEKEKLFELIHDCLDKYAYVHLYSVKNMRNNYLKEVREKWKENGRFFFGRNRVIAKALGNTPEEEVKENLHLLSSKLVGEVGLFFTNEKPDKVLEFFKNYHAMDYARTDTFATEKITIPEGRVHRGEEPMPPNMYEALLKLNVPVHKRNGEITVDNEFVICNVGDVLTPNQTNLLKMFYHQLAEFHVKIVAYWHDGQVHDV